MKRSIGIKLYLFLTVIVSQQILIQCGSSDSVFRAILKLPSFSLPNNDVHEDDQSNSLNSVDLPPDVPPDYLQAEKEFTQLRIEYIKNQILKKLRLKETPTGGVEDLPKPLKEYENSLPEAFNNAPNSYYDDFYGKTTQAVVFPTEDDVRCLRKNRFPSACLPFQLPSDIHGSDVSKAELWIHKEKDPLDEHNQTFVISEVAHWDTNKSFQKTKPIAIQETNIKEGWLKIDVTYVIKNWLDFQDSPTHAINVACKTCGMNKVLSPISFSKELKPFLIIYTHSQQRRQQQHRRMKRSSNCGPGVNECCRENLYISFAEIGWDNWIMQPKGYNAYFCRGSCISGSAMTLTGSDHTYVLMKVMYGDRENRALRPELTPCCTATQYQPLQLLYKNNNTVVTKLLPNMIVDACQCM